MTLDQIEELRVKLLDKERRNRALEESNSAMEVFAYSVAHDLRAPLHVIVGLSRILQCDSVGLDSKEREHLQTICEVAKRMGQIVDDLLNLSCSAAEKLVTTPVDLAALALDVMRGFRARQPERAVDFIVGDGLQIQGAPRLLRILLENLLGNAWKYTSRCAAARIEIGYLPDLAAYFVSDNGTGFDMAYADKLFLPFLRLHTAAEFEGTGIGLFIVKRIVERHGGKVWAEASPPRGATIYFTLVK